MRKLLDVFIEEAKEELTVEWHEDELRSKLATLMVVMSNITDTYSITHYQLMDLISKAHAQCAEDGIISEDGKFIDN